MKPKRKKTTNAAKLKTYRLMPELVPAPLWGVSAYRRFGKTRPWKEIRQDALELAENKCGACDADGLAGAEPRAYELHTRERVRPGSRVPVCHK
jgi:hypothetical protein